MAFNYWQTLEEGLIYHIYNRSVNRERLFRNEGDYSSFLKKVEKYLIPYMDIDAYALIPNHFHLLVKVLPITPPVKSQIEKEDTRAAKKLLADEISLNDFIEDQFRRMFSSYALSYNHRYNRTGTLFQRRSKRVNITHDVKLLRVFCYIHHNGIHHKLVSEYAAWRYSSYNAILSNKPTLINRDKVLEWFGMGNKELGRQRFLEYHAEYRHPPFEDWMLDFSD